MNKLYRFWQELKRRNVVRRNTVYAATAFVILELVSIIQEPLKLPEWTLTLVIILLSAGLVVSVILSWIYEVDPEKGLVRTMPSAEVEQEEPGDLKFRSWKIATYISLVVIAGLIVLNLFSRPESVNEPIIPQRTIAVLPLENLSPDSTQFYFCEAMREEILNHLDKVEMFTVRSRTSTDRYRNTEKSTIDIGKELNVSYLVEGSVGLDENMIKIWLQLIDARTDEHLWSADFTREKKQIFSLQTEIAEKLASELQATISPEEMERIEKSPTDNPDAYQAYLRGNYFASRPHDDRDHWDNALASYQEAVHEDSTFAIAWAALAKTYALFHDNRYDLSETNMKNADHAALKALKYGDGDPEVHLQLGYYYLYGYNDQEEQNKHWDIASRGMPNNVEFLKARYLSLRKKGNWEGAIDEIKRAAKLDPNDIQIYSELAIALWFVRRYSESDDAWNKANTASPEDPFPPSGRVFNLLAWKGISDETSAAVQYLNPRNNWTPYLRFWFAAASGHMEKALEMVQDSANGWIVNTPVYRRPNSLYRGLIYHFSGEEGLAVENFRTAANILEARVREVPNDNCYHTSLAIAYAALGRKESALSELQKGTELRPLSDDAMYGTSPLFDAIIVYIFLGELDRATEQLEYLLSIPSPYSVKWVEWYPPFASLKQQPGFETLRKKYPIAE